MFKKKRFSQALHESAKSIEPSPLTYQSILAAVMPEAVKEGRVSYSAAAGQVENLNRRAAAYRKSRVGALSFVAVAATLLLLIMPGEQTSIIPDEPVPLADQAFTIECQTMDDGHVQISAPTGEEVLWQEVYALDHKGNHIAPAFVLPEQGLAVFAPPADDMIICIPLASGAVVNYEYER